MLKRIVKKLLAPIVREAVKEEINKSEAVNDQILKVLKRQLP